MQVTLEHDEAWSLMTVITSYVIDNAGLSAEGKAAVRKWRTEHAQGTPAMAALTDDMNRALGAYVGEATNRVIKGKRYRKAREAAL